MAFIIKKSQDISPQKNNIKVSSKKQENVMDKISVIESIIEPNNDAAKKIKRLKKDKGLIERTESSKTILTEDNKQLLVD